MAVGLDSVVSRRMFDAAGRAAQDLKSAPMTMAAARPCLVVLAVLVGLVGLFGFVSDGRAQELVHFAPLEWEATLAFDGSVRRTETSRTEDLEFEESVDLRQSGYGLDPRILTFSFEVEPLLSQGKFESTNQSEEREGQFLSYTAAVSALHGTTAPVGVNAQAGRSSGTDQGSLGSRTDFVTENRNLTLVWKTFFPSSISYSERTLDQSFRSGLDSATRERDEVTRRVRVRGRSSKMNLSFEHSVFDDRIEETDNDFVTDRADLFHSVRWGKGSSLRSRTDYFNRKDFRSSTRFGVSEFLNLQHTDDLSTDYTYNFSAAQGESDTTRHVGRFALGHQLYRSLNTSLNLSRSHTDFESGVEDVSEAGLDLGYRKRIPWDGALSAGVGAAYRLTDRVSQADVLQVFDEEQPVTGTGSALLNQRFIATASIVVTNAAGTVVFTEGTDYSVVPSANNLTEIRILGGGAISIGDTIVVDYRFESLPSAKYSAIPFNYRARLDFGWVALFHRTSITNEDLISGPDESIVRDRRQSTTGIRFNFVGRTTRATHSAELRQLRSGEFETESLMLNQSLTHAFSRGLSVATSSNETFTESDDTNSELYSVDLFLRWLPLRNLSIRPNVGAWRRIVEETSDERFITGGFALRWAWRKIDFDLNYDHDIREQLLPNSSQTIEDRLMLTLTRRSR